MLAKIPKTPVTIVLTGVLELILFIVTSLLYYLFSTLSSYAFFIASRALFKVSL